MANRDCSDSRVTHNVIDQTKTEHKNDPTEGEAHSAAPGSPARHSHDADFVLELRRYRAQLRDHEKTLIGRIADVDDDRRASEARLQRAWQARSEKVDSRLRLHTLLIAGLLILFAAALSLAYRQAANGQLEAAAAVSDLRREMARLPGKDPVDAQARTQVELLRVEVQEIASSLKGHVKRPEQAIPASAGAVLADRGHSEPVPGEALRKLGAEQKRLAEAVQSLRSAMRNLETRLVAPPAENQGKRTEESDLSIAAPPILPAPDAAPAEPLTDAGAAGAIGIEERTGPARQGPDASASASRKTLVAAEGHYALQLTGAFDRKLLERFVVEHGLTARAYSIRLTYNDRPWYALIHSLHEGYSAAAEALSRLPSDLAALNPWIRPLPAGAELHIIEAGPNRK